MRHTILILLATLTAVIVGAQSSTYTPGKVGEYNQRGYVAPATIRNTPAPSNPRTSPSPAYTTPSNKSYSSPAGSPVGSHSSTSKKSSGPAAPKPLTYEEAELKKRDELRLLPLFCNSCPMLEKGFVNEPGWLHDWAMNLVFKVQYEAAVEYIATKVPEANITNLDPSDFSMFFDLYDRVLRGAKQDQKLAAFWKRFPEEYKKQYPNGAK